MKKIDYVIKNSIVKNYAINKAVTELCFGSFVFQNFATNRYLYFILFCFKRTIFLFKSFDFIL